MAVFGWHDRTIGAQVDTPDGPRWLRVISEHERWVPDAAIADDMVFRGPVDLPPVWWASSHRGLNAVGEVRDAKRVVIGDEVLRYRLHAAFDADIEVDRLDWSCAHGDMHRAATTPRSCIARASCCQISPVR
ncbi:hypothetical protein [Amycolatopsis sp. NPDC051071]|uniref:hypothetical protein n=1 Tax=Amycolatopsis sp. NPDC051071 TaxID=3154637 RepID=UPI00344898E2